MATRKITDAAFDLIDKRLQYPYAKQCIDAKSARLLYIEAVKSLIGVTETKEDEGPEVDLFLATFGLTKAHWCMAFQQTCVAYVEKKLSVVSPLYASAGVLNVWNHTPEEYRVKTVPLVGAIACFEHTNKPGNGHTGMVLDCDGETMHTIEGNKSEEKGAKVGGAKLLGVDGIRLVTRAYNFTDKQKGTTDLVLRGCVKPFAFPA